jgi:hypothetical protein
MSDELKRFFCGTKEICYFKEHYINSRCFANYRIRQTCPNILRKDRLTQAQGSKEEDVLCQ